MNPGYARILTCPQCGTKKEVLNLISGNTFDQTLWSDNKSIAPMLPRVSFVQKCPGCGKYYLMSRQKKEEYGDTYSYELGELSYEEIKRAWEMMKYTAYSWFENEKMTVFLMIVWAFNDKYTRYQKINVPKEEQVYINDIIWKLMMMDSVDNVLKAEFLREMGDFDGALDILDHVPLGNEFLEGVKTKIKEHAQASDTRPFIIYGDGLPDNMRQD